MPVFPWHPLENHPGENTSGESVSQALVILSNIPKCFFLPGIFKEDSFDNTPKVLVLKSPKSLLDLYLEFVKKLIEANAILHGM